MSEPELIHIGISGWHYKHWEGLTSLVTQGVHVYCNFDNDQYGYAPQNALELKDMLCT